jgi:hypothetical protein
MYNSAFFSSLASHDYSVIHATEDWVNDAAYKLDDGVDLDWLVPSNFDVAKVQRSMSGLQTLSNTECIKAHATDFTPSRQTVVVVCDETSSKDASPLLGIAHKRFAAGGSPVVIQSLLIEELGLLCVLGTIQKSSLMLRNGSPMATKQNTVSASWSQNLSICVDTMSMLQLSGSS